MSVLGRLGQWGLGFVILLGVIVSGIYFLEHVSRSYDSVARSDGDPCLLAVVPGSATEISVVYHADTPETWGRFRVASASAALDVPPNVEEVSTTAVNPPKRAPPFYYWWWEPELASTSNSVPPRNRVFYRGVVFPGSGSEPPIHAYLVLDRSQGVGQFWCP